MCGYQGACMVWGMHGCQGGHVWDTMRYGQWAGGTHPTAMHSCLHWNDALITSENILMHFNTILQKLSPKNLYDIEKFGRQKVPPVSTTGYITGNVRIYSEKTRPIVHTNVISDFKLHYPRDMSQSCLDTTRLVFFKWRKPGILNGRVFNFLSVPNSLHLSHFINWSTTP